MWLDWRLSELGLRCSLDWICLMLSSTLHPLVRSSLESGRIVKKYIPWAGNNSSTSLYVNTSTQLLRIFSHITSFIDLACLYYLEWLCYYTLVLYDFICLTVYTLLAGPCIVCYNKTKTLSITTYLLSYLGCSCFTCWPLSSFILYRSYGSNASIL